MNYQEFIELVPKETRDFVDAVLPLLYYYSSDDEDLFFKNVEDVSRHLYSKSFFLLLYILSLNKDYSSILEIYGFDREKYNLSIEVNKDIDLEKAFKKILPFIPDFDDKLSYEKLYPINIVLKALKLYNKYNNHCNLAIFNNILFPRAKNIDQFKKKLKKVNNNKINLIEQELENSLYGNLNISVINYLETASKIRSILIKSLNEDIGDIYRKIDKDLIPLSLFLAIFSYNDIALLSNEQITEKEALIKYLNNKKITIDALKNELDIRYDEADLNEAKNLLAIKKYYIKYCEDLCVSGKKMEDITVSDIFQKVLDRNYTDSYVLDKLLAKFDVNIRSLTDIKENIKKIISDMEEEYSLQYVEDFYSDLSKETKDFIEFTAKIYQLILKKMQKNEHNNKVLNNENDASSLALYISNCYYNGDVNKFFMEYDITLNKVLSFLKLDISKEEIEKVELDQKLLINKFKRFVYEGVNKNKTAKSIKIQDIIYNLCDRNFNKSMIMENVFSSLTDKLDLESDFSTQLKETLLKKELKRKKLLEQKLFYDIDVSVIHFLERVSSIHNELKTINPNFDDRDVKSYSLILAALMEDNDISKFLKKIGFTKNNVCNFLNIDSNRFNVVNADIDILATQYEEYIFGGVNEGKKREKIKVENILQNAFNKEINNSVSYRKFLANFDYDNSDKENFSKLKEEFDSKQEEKRQIKKICDFVNEYNNVVVDFINLTLKIYQRLNANLTNNTILKTDDDLAVIALILALSFKEEQYFKFFELRNLDRRQILINLGFNNDILDDVEDEEINYSLFPMILAKYFKDDYPLKHTNIDLHEIFCRVFDETISKSSVLKDLTEDLNVDYNKLKKEINLGVSYDDSLSLDDHINSLMETDIDPISIDDSNSLLSFGDSLISHSMYINNEYPKILLSDIHDEAIAKINEIINKLYVTDNQKNKKSSFLAKFFAVDASDKGEFKLVLNKDTIKELIDSIESNIEALKEEYRQYLSMRIYMEEYRKKNSLYYLKAVEITEELEEEIKKLNPNEELEYSHILVLDADLDNMREKAKRFMTVDLLMKQNLASVNQAIKSHNLTLNALEMARDVLVPLVVSQLCITKGSETEKLGIELSQDIFSLFQAMLQRNMNSTKENLSRLKDSLISEETYKSINDSIQTYLDELSDNSESLKNLLKETGQGENNDFAKSKILKKIE